MKNRWFVVLGALIIQMSLGAVYIYSVFKTPLTTLFGWDKSQVTLPSQIILACFALAVVIAGRIQDRIGPRWVATAGGVILGAGLILASMAERMGGLPWFVATFSVIGGLGIGTAYVCPIAACVKWFPDKRGLITGLAVAGFGAGSLIFGPLANSFINSYGVMATFRILGIIFLVAVVIGAQFMTNPPAGYRPEGWNPPAAAAAASTSYYTWSQMLATPQFWMLWIAYFAACTAGLGVIMNASNIWQSFAASAQAAGGTSLADTAFKGIKAAGATTVSTIAIFNALGRIAWGKVSDSLGSRTKTLLIMFVGCALAMFALNYMRSYGLFVVASGLVGFCFGGFLALYPAITADYYGTKFSGVNYGFMFLAYGAGGLVGPLLLAKLSSKVGTLALVPADAAAKAGSFDVLNYLTAFVVCAVMCVVAAGLILLVKPPAVKQVAQ